MALKEVAGLIDRDRKYRVIGSDLKEYGPIAGFKLAQWLMEERITLDSPVKLEGAAEWRPLKSLVGGVIGRQIPPPLGNIAQRLTDAFKHKQ